MGKPTKIKQVNRKTPSRRGWYDGWFYAWIIDSDFSELRNRIFKYVEPGKKVLDVGCGTGGFTLKLAKFSEYVCGIDVSGDQISVAKKRMLKSGLKNIDFLHANATALADHINEQFDYAIIIFVIHEIDHTERIQLLKQVAQIAQKLVILDYHHPMSKNIPGFVIRLTELFAGRNHFANFRDYSHRGGIMPLLKDAGLTIMQDRVNRPGVFRTIVATKSPNSL